MHESSNLVTAADDGTLRVWNVESGSLRQTLEGPGARALPDHRRAVEALVFMHGAALKHVCVAVGGDQVARFWDIKHCVLLHQHFTGVSGVCGVVWLVKSEAGPLEPVCNLYRHAHKHYSPGHCLAEHQSKLRGIANKSTDLDIHSVHSQTRNNTKPSPGTSHKVHGVSPDSYPQHRALSGRVRGGRCDHPGQPAPLHRRHPGHRPHLGPLTGCCRLCCHGARLRRGPQPGRGAGGARRREVAGAQQWREQRRRPRWAVRLGADVWPGLHGLTVERRRCPGWHIWAGVLRLWMSHVFCTLHVRKWLAKALWRRSAWWVSHSLCSGSVWFHLGATMAKWNSELGMVCGPGPSKQGLANFLRNSTA